MPDLLRYHGLELPKFDPDEVPIAVSKEEIQQAAANTDSNTIVRLAFLDAIGCPTLKYAIDAFYDGIEQVSEDCGADVVGHQFGLCEWPLMVPYAIGQDTLTENPGILPEGHILVAEVDVIRNLTELTQAQEAAIACAAVAYRCQSLRSSFQHRWNDLLSEQFKNGVGPYETEERLWLLDIEPALTTIV